MPLIVDRPPTPPPRGPHGLGALVFWPSMPEHGRGHEAEGGDEGAVGGTSRDWLTRVRVGKGGAGAVMGHQLEGRGLLVAILCSGELGGRESNVRAGIGVGTTGGEPSSRFPASFGSRFRRQRDDEGPCGLILLEASVRGL